MTRQCAPSSLLRQTSGVSLVHVAYRGGAPAVTDLLGNQIPMVFSSLVTVLPHIRSGKLRAAALDVYDPEPPSPDSCLFSAPNLVLSPHLAGASRETAERACRIAADEVARYVRGEPLAHVANPAAIAGE